MGKCDYLCLDSGMWLRNVNGEEESGCVAKSCVMTSLNVKIDPRVTATYCITVYSQPTSDGLQTFKVVYRLKAPKHYFYQRDNNGLVIRYGL
jgi:hypothetical protein